MLKGNLDKVLCGRQQVRFFFPLCGKAVDMKWLADMGHVIVGVEISEKAIKQFFEEHSLEYKEEPVPAIPGAKLFKYPPPYGAAPDAPTPPPSPENPSDQGNPERSEEHGEATRGGSEEQGKASGGSEVQGEAGGGSEEPGEVSGRSEEQSEANGGRDGHDGKAGGSQTTSTAEQKRRATSTAEQGGRATSPPSSRTERRPPPSSSTERRPLTHSRDERRPQPGWAEDPHREGGRESPDGRISLYQCDLYKFSSAIEGQFGGIWDRGSLVAINPCDRQKYASLIMSLMDKDCRYLLDTLEYNPELYKGPPFFVPEEAVKSLYGDSFIIELVQSRDAFEERFKAWGIDSLVEKVYLLTPKAKLN
ncbi:hypothetical protein QTP86_018510 [Hemibagrus guttatus]|nr:hypothetical protein QTP86_018510 [Hemibagrus guttatus]